MTALKNEAPSWIDNRQAATMPVMPLQCHERQYDARYGGKQLQFLCSVDFIGPPEVTAVEFNHKFNKFHLCVLSFGKSHH